MRVVHRRFTKPPKAVPVHPHRRSTDYVADREFDTLTRRFRAIQDGDSLYPWANTRLQIANGKRRWIAKKEGEH